MDILTIPTEWYAIFVAIAFGVMGTIFGNIAKGMLDSEEGCWLSPFAFVLGLLADICDALWIIFLLGFFYWCWGGGLTIIIK